MRQRLELALRMRRAARKIPTASTYLEHLHMAEAIMSVPPAVTGVAVEAGCFMGGSTASLSLACDQASRELVVFDSFTGLPEPDEGDARHEVTLTGQAHLYSKGAFSGRLEEVEANVGRYGAIDRCQFVPGYFEKSLASFDSPVIFAFIDADLTQSVKTCVRRIWPMLRSGCRMYIHEAHHREITALFYDRDFWTEMQSEPPGLVGGGSGLGLSVHRLTPLGYAVKNPALGMQTVEDMVVAAPKHPGS